MGRKYDFELLLMRHGEARSWSDEGDRGRVLTENGRDQIKETVGAFEALGWHWGLGATSGYTRAQETYDALLHSMYDRALNDHHIKLPEASEVPDLAPSGDPERAARALIGIGENLAGPQPRVLAVAHNPILPAIAGVLLAGDPNLQLALGTGDVIHLFIPAPSHFDVVLAPQEQEPLPRAYLLGMYPRHALAAIAAQAAK